MGIQHFKLLAKNTKQNILRHGRFTVITPMLRQDSQNNAELISMSGRVLLLHTTPGWWLAVVWRREGISGEYTYIKRIVH